MKVLVVDDAATNRTLLRAQLHKRGHEVREAENGSDALQLLRREPVDLIISDVMMPVMDGYQLCRECKRDPALQNIPFMFVTAAYLGEQDEQFALKLGALRYLRRPLSSGALFSAVDDVLAEGETSRSSAPPSLPSEDAPYFAEYSARVVQKLEEKVRELETTARERARAIAEKAASEQRFRALVEQASDVIASLDPEGRIRYVSPAISTVLGYAPSELVGRSLEELAAPSEAAQIRDDLASLVREPVRIVRTLRYRHKDGSERVLQSSSRSCLDDPAVGGIIVNARDITESEAARARSERILLQRAAVEHLVTSISTRLVSAGSTQLDEAVEAALCELASFGGADRGALYRVGADGRQLVRTHGWSGPMVAMQDDDGRIDLTVCSWLNARLHERRITYVGAVGQLPSDAAGERALCAQREMGSFICMPMVHADALLGCVIIASVHEGASMDETDTMLLATVADVFASTLARRDAERVLKRANRALRVVSMCNAAVIHAIDAAKLLEQVCRVIVESGGYRSASAHYAEESGTTPRLVAQHGEDELGEPPGSEPRLLRLVLGDASRPLGSVQIRAASEPLDDAEVKLLEELAEEISYGLVTLRTRAERDRVVRERRVADMNLRRSLEESIQAIAATFEMRDPYTAGHQRRVAILCGAIARRLGLSEERIHGLRLAATIHDLGKIQIPSDILNKPGRLNAIEFELIKRHPQIGHEIMKDVQLPWNIAEMIWQHHEHIDGTGYPLGLKGSALSLEARILTVADVAEAMSSHRPYRPALGVVAAIEELERYRGTRYDPAAVDACVEVLRSVDLVADPALRSLEPVEERERNHVS